MIRGVAAAASSSVAAAAAAAALEAGGSAVDALIAGFFAAAGEAPGVLLAPVVALVAGVGVGARVFDGRAAQPGLGAPRPRGFVGGAPIPAAARVAAPRSIAMLALLHAHRGRVALSTLARPGVEAADAAGAKSRAALLRRVGASGVLALRATDAARALLLAGGAVAGGILTQGDLEESRPAEEIAWTGSLPDGTTVYAPPYPRSSGATQAIVACDARGIVAALAYTPSREGVLVPELELLLGLTAVPVQRGVQRLAPGTPIPAAAPLAIASRKGGFWAALALPGRPAIEPESLADLASGAAFEAALTALAAHTGEGPALAAVTDGREARGISIS